MSGRVTESNLLNLYEQAVANGDKRALAQIITLFLNDFKASFKVLPDLFAHDNAHVVGIAGPPGAGKSTIIGSILEKMTWTKKVAVLAEDPSGCSGGAFLGDRIRMEREKANDNLYIRSVCSSDAGKSNKAEIMIVVKLLSQIFDLVLVEAVGGGQSSLDTLQYSDTTILVLSQNYGDDIQLMKSGIFEEADLIVLNKTDNSEEASTALNRLLLYKDYKKDPGWQRPVCTVSAATLKGISELIDSVNRHQKYLVDSDRYSFLRDRQKGVLLKEIVFRKIIEALEEKSLNFWIKDFETVIGKHLTLKDLLKQEVYKITEYLKES